MNVTESQSDSDDAESTQSTTSTVDDDMNMNMNEFEGDDHADLLDEFQPQSVPNEDDGELVMSLSESTIAHLWAVTGLVLLVNITFCLYRMWRSAMKQRRFSESDHYESEPEPETLDPDLEEMIESF